MPFQLDHASLDPFEPQLRSVMRTAFSGGLQALGTLGVTVEAIKTDSKALSRFLRGCHRGYDKAQQYVGSLVIEIQREIAVREVELKEYRRNKDPKHAVVQDQITVLRNRQLTLRRIMDTILCLMTRLDTWILRRLVLDRRIRDIDPVVLRKGIDVATRRNSENRLRFSLATDLTTIAQIGDLVEVSFDSKKPYWRVIELKEGRINEILCDLLDANRDQPDEKVSYERIVTGVGQHAADQLTRIKQQRTRLELLEEIIVTDKGVDPTHNIPLVITPEKVFTDSYDEAIDHVIDAANKREVACTSLSGCLRLVALRQDHVRGDYMGAVGHALLHMRDPASACNLFEGQEQSLEEVEKIKKGPPFIDLVAHSMRAQWGRPIFLWTDPKKTADLVMGRFRLFVQFDIEAFFALAEREGIKMSWITGKAAEKLKRDKISARIPGSPNAWGVQVVTPDGTVQTLLSGFIARVIADLTTPRQLLELVTRMAKQSVKNRTLV